VGRFDNNSKVNKFSNLGFPELYFRNIPAFEKAQIFPIFRYK
jgi:hypothetical protein